MIIQIADYRAYEPARTQQYAEDSRDNLQVNGNAALARKFDTRSGHAETSPDLPDHFDNFNAKAFIDRAYSLATQI